MTASPTWQETNARHLAAALAWLRLRLERLAGGGDAVVVAADRAEAEMALCEAQADPPPALCALAQAFGLSRFERDVLLLCVAMELDTRLPSLCARAQGDASRNHPTFALALALFDDAAWDVVSPERPLRRWHLVEAHPAAAQPLTGSPLRADERIVNHVQGLQHLDERLAQILAPAAGSAAEPLPPSQETQARRIDRAWTHRPADAPWPAATLLGADTPSKLQVAHAVAARHGWTLHHLAPALLPTRAADVDLLASLWQREGRLSPAALFVDRLEAGAVPAQREALERFVARVDGPLFVDARSLAGDARRDRLLVDIARPTAAEQRALWSRALAPDGDALAPALAAQFALDAAAIVRIAAETRADAADGAATAEALWESCKAASRPALEALAERIAVKAGWNDIVLPPEPLGLLRQVCAQVRCRHQVYEDWGFARRMNRGLGIAALFGGASGVGKTMAAEVIAGDLRLDLYRIDLSSVVSKYIGETEDNLRRVFDAAEDGGAILFFDECDALFGKRSEVKDSHDRYANIQTNYLLQRLESYGGLAILATNARSALDTAFTRRLRFIVDFPFPGPAERAAIWRKAFPPGTPCERLDVDRLGRFNVSGATIHNAALCAAFLAAQAGARISMAHVMAALRAETVKLGKPVNEADFRVAVGAGAAA